MVKLPNSLVENLLTTVIVNSFYSYSVDVTVHILSETLPFATPLKSNTMAPTIALPSRLFMNVILAVYSSLTLALKRTLYLVV